MFVIFISNLHIDYVCSLGYARQIDPNLTTTTQMKQKYLYEKREDTTK